MHDIIEEDEEHLDHGENYNQINDNDLPQRTKISSLVCVTDEYQFLGPGHLPSYTGSDKKEIRRLPGYEEYEFDENLDYEKFPYSMEESPRPQHKQKPLSPTNWELVSRLNLQPRIADNFHSKQDHERMHQMKLLRAIKYSVLD